ncbi:MAG: hypothetical protein K2W92_02520 [Alphaproteobacteria bacterium]|nr:hypothetical protein [Alphaproteobacteria bacterium]
MNKQLKKGMITLAVLSIFTNQSYAQSNPPNSVVVDSSNTSQVTAYGAIAVGPNSTVNSINSVSIGTANTIDGAGRGFILGNVNTIYDTLPNTYSFIFGLGLSNNGFQNCIAFGRQTSDYIGCTNNNQINAGGLTLTGIGLASQSSDAVSLGQVQSMLGSSGGTTDLSGVQSQIDTHTGQISTLNSQVGSLQISQQTLSNQVNSIQVQTDNNTTDISSLKTTTDNHTQQISSIQTNQVVMQNQINGNTSDIGVLKNTTATHTEQITTIQSNQVVMQKEIVSNTTDINTLKTVTTNHTEQISTLYENQNKIVEFEQAIYTQTNNNTKSISQLNNRVDSLENRVNGLEGDMKSYAYSAAALAMASNINFNPFLDRQIGIGMATVGGKSAIAMGLAVRQGNSTISVKLSKSSNMPIGASASASWGF